MKKNLLKLFFALVAIVMVSACGARKDIVYVQGAENLGEIENPVSYSAKIQKDDQLNIIVNCKEPELAAPFNMQLNTRAFTGGVQTTITSYNTGTPQVFWVDAQGNINYPTIGKLYVEGMTRSELAAKLEKYLKDNGFIQDPIVNVTFYNYKISVLGEVARPGQFSLSNDRVSVFDAIAMAGDLTIFGERDKVRLIREENGKQQVFALDLRDPNIIASPYYYLHQNDVLYIEPNQTKASNREVSNLYSFGVSLASLAITIATFIRTF